MAQRPSRTICICGGGNGAHVATGLTSANAWTEVRVLTLFRDEAARWTEKLKGGDLVVVKNHPDGRKEEIKSKPNLVTNDASKAVPGADVIIFCLPAFAHQEYFTAIAPYVGENTSIIGLPGQPGFEFQCMHTLKERAKTCAILNFETLPWACRINEFGRKVDLLGVKEGLLGSKVKGQSNPVEEPTALLQAAIGVKPVLTLAGSYLEIILMSMPFFHPAIMYAKWKDWDGKPMAEKPLFYQGLSEYAVSLLSELSEEVMDLKRAIEKARPDLKCSQVETVESWFMRTYKLTIKDDTSLYTAMRTNTAYDGLVHPMKESSGQWVPDFSYRYLAEDVPFAFAITKGLAEILGVPTPGSDIVLAWSQEKLGKEYIVKVGNEYKLQGKDVPSTRSPQAYGMNSLEQLLAMV